MSSKNMAAYMAARRKERRSRLIFMSGGRCADCGSVDNLEFNHKDRTQKLFGLDLKGMDGPWTKILDEWLKCELLCREHHQDRTRIQYQSGEIVQPNSMKHLPYIHGTMRMYQEKACRCASCRLAKKEYRNGGTTYSQVFVHSPVG